MRKLSPLVIRCVLLLTVVASLHFLAAAPVLAQESSQKTEVGSDLLISYQGRLTDTDGNPVADTDHTLVFKLYDQAEGGTPIWQETQNIETSNGVFSARLGAVNSLDGLDFDQQYYLGIEVDGGDEFSPRTELTDVPYAVRAYSVSDEAVTSDALGSGAVTTAKIGDRAVTTDKLDYAAVDSARLDPTAVTKTLRPTLELDAASQYVGVNRDNAITGNDFFSVSAPVNDDVFGGMYLNTEGAEAWPFYGYATDEEAHAWHLFDPGESEWILEFDFTSPRFRLVVDEQGVRPGGDDDLTLGTSNHRWSVVHAANGTIQTSDRRLKTNIDTLNYGLDEILRLNPVSYRWADGAGAEASAPDRRLGLIAQQVQDVVSEAVEEPADGDGYLGMNYSELIPVLVRAIQQQQQIIERQHSALQAQEDNMQAQLTSLKQQVRQLARELEAEGSGRQGQPVTTTSSE